MRAARANPPVPDRGRRRLAATVPALLLLAVAGCAAMGRAEAPDRTGGRTLEMYVTASEDSFVRYRVECDGVISYAGGLDAIAGDYSWSGPLTDEEIRRLFSIAEEHGWYRRAPASTGEPETRHYRIDLTAPGERRSFEIVGGAPGVEAAESLLAAASARRLGGFLDTLPRPGAPSP